MSVATESLSPAFELQPYKSLENDELAARIETIRRQMGPSLLILGHHYQQDEVIALADGVISLRGRAGGELDLALDNLHPTRNRQRAAGADFRPGISGRVGR